MIDMPKLNTVWNQGTVPLTQLKQLQQETHETVDHLVDALQKGQAGADEQKDLLGKLAALRGQVGTLRPQLPPTPHKSHELVSSWTDQNGPLAQDAREYGEYRDYKYDESGQISDDTQTGGNFANLSAAANESFKTPGGMAGKEMVVGQKQLYHEEEHGWFVFKHKDQVADGQQPVMGSVENVVRSSAGAIEGSIDHLVALGTKIQTHGLTELSHTYQNELGDYTDGWLTAH